MISPSESGAAEVSQPAAGNLWKNSQRASSVLPLEFKAIDHPLRRKNDWMVTDAEELDADENSLREEVTDLETRLRAQVQQIAINLGEARIEARLAARTEWETEFDERIAKERKRVADVCAAFTAERARYFVSVEEEVVRLALAIATRVLHREAKLDPMLLSAVVRMALEKVAEESGAVLHVPSAEAASWRAMLAAESQSAVTVVGEDRMELAECFLETAVGRVELGVGAQLEEIEKGFFDLLRQRPV